ncbi:NAD(P)/FAD-dependent oxidoreductase [Arcobacter sp. LA11]|uniref:flavin-dependent monooxygenase QhpG n=1 Tax=Arcobacter sp. LA11 TaxID=1898176 RepID=UPI000934E1A2|nr:tryptophan 7-halogenase [Arcobacter sp. LA11]
MNPTKKIAVIGAGIAGITTAIGLKKLGFDVTIIYKERAFTAYEGFSEKTKDGLKLIGCAKSSELLKEQSSRNSNWANTKSNANYEYVVNRDDFDKCMLEDARTYDIKIIKAKVLETFNLKEKVKVIYKKESMVQDLEVEFLVDTRGRFTPFKNEYIYGPKSFSLLQELELNDVIENKTSIDSVKNGWIWQAYVGENKGYIQFTCDEALAHKIKTFEDLKPYLEECNIDLWSLEKAKVDKKIVKRDSYSKIHKNIINEKMILIGDAASSIDPLSGNGAFQAMSMSSIAPYVINTILNKKENKEVAIRFYKKRVEYIFEKFSNVGKDFYSLEKRYDTDFWKQRQNWPKENDKELKTVSIENYGIVKDGFIEPKEVVVTKDNPLGIYFFQNVEILGLVKYCLKNSYEDSKTFFKNFIEKNNIDINLSKVLERWLYEQRILIKE